MVAMSSGDDPMSDPRLGDGVEHLQTAAHEMLAAARTFLDVVEDVVSDREKLSTVAASVTELLGSAGGSLARMAERVSGAGGGHGPSGEGPDAPTTRRPRVRHIDVD